MKVGQEDRLDGAWGIPQPLQIARTVGPGIHNEQLVPCNDPHTRSRGAGGWHRAARATEHNMEAIGQRCYLIGGHLLR